MPNRRPQWLFWLLCFILLSHFFFAGDGWRHRSSPSISRSLFHYSSNLLFFSIPSLFLFFRYLKCWRLTCGRDELCGVPSLCHSELCLGCYVLFALARGSSTKYLFAKSRESCLPSCVAEVASLNHLCREPFVVLLTHAVFVLFFYVCFHIFFMGVYR